MQEFLILIVDEDGDNQEFIAERLRNKDRRIINTSCTGEAEKIISENPVNMIIIDTGAGKHCGISFLRRVFKNKEAPSIPVFMMSYKDDLSTKLMSYISGALRFFAKPIDVEELVSVVERFEVKRKQCVAL